jgi:D-aminopeptidase
MASTEGNIQSGVLDEIFAPFNRSDAPGMVVGIAQRGKLLYRRGLGLASLELGVTNTPMTRMRIGSTSKHFTCLAILLLAEEGKLGIDDSIRKTIPELPVLAGEATLRQLMNHTSGYRCYLTLAFMSGNAMLDLGDAFKYQVLQEDVNFAPGERMDYCNGGYHLLSIVVERISGISFEAFLKQRIFEPLGMVNTDSVPSDHVVVPGRATPHLPTPDGGYRRGVLPLEDLKGEGAIVSTVDDMLLWLAHLRGQKRVGNASSWEQMLTPPAYSSGAAGTYCLGLEKEMYRGVEVIHHAGGVMGGASQMITVPSRELDIFIATNGVLVDPSELAFKVIDALLGDDGLEPIPLRVKTADFKGALGYYWSKAGRRLVEIADDEGNLSFNYLHSAALPVYAENDGYKVPYPGLGPLGFKVIAASAGEPVNEPESASIEWCDCGQREPMQRLFAPAPSAPEFVRGLTGRYFSHDMDASATLRIEGEQVLLELNGAHGGFSSTLTALSDEVATTACGPEVVFGVPMVLVADRETHGFWLSTVRSVNLYFARTGVTGEEG